MKEKLPIILACFERTLPGEKKALFTMGIKLTEKQFTMANWEKQFKAGGSKEKEEAITLTETICSFISQRILAKIDINHPYHLLCFELIKWIVTTLSSLEHSEESHAKVSKRVAYLNALVSEDSLFSSDDPSDKAMRDLLITVEKRLSSNIISTLPVSDPKSHAAPTPSKFSTLIKSLPPKLDSKTASPQSPETRQDSSPDKTSTTTTASLPSATFFSPAPQEPVRVGQADAEAEEPSGRLSPVRDFPKRFGDSLKRRSQLFVAGSTEGGSAAIALIPASDISSADLAKTRERYLKRLQRRSSLVANHEITATPPRIPSQSPPQIRHPESSAQISDSSTKTSEPKNEWSITEVVTDDNIVRIVESLLKISKSILLQERQIGPIGVYRLCEFLSSGDPPPDIETLNLSGNTSIFSENSAAAQKAGIFTPYPGATGIAHFLSKTKSLKVLSLSLFEKIPIASFNCIANGLSDNESLECLDLSSSNLSDDAAISLCRALESHKTLCVLLIGHNRFTDKSAKSLIGLLTTNTNIVDIDVRGNAFSAAVVDQLESLAAKNSGAVQPRHSNGF